MSPRRALTAIVLVIAVVGLGLWTRHDTSATTFSPAPPTPRLCTPGTVIDPSGFGCTDNVSTSGNPDIVSPFDVPQPNAQFAGAIAFNSPDFALADHTIANGWADGDAVGETRAIATLGLENEACTILTPIIVNFAPMMKASVDNSAGNLAPPSGTLSGQGLLLNYREDDGDVNNDNTTSVVGTQVGVTNLAVASSALFAVLDTIKIEITFGTAPDSRTITAIPDATHITLDSAVTASGGDLVVDPDIDARAFNGVPDGAEWYPTYINDLLDPDGPGAAVPIVPTARYVGFAVVSGTTIVLHFIQASPGALEDLADLTPNGLAHAGQGIPSLTVLQNPLQTPNNSSITDFCTPLSTSILQCGKEDTTVPLLPSWQAPSSSSTVPNGCTVGANNRLIGATTTGTRESKALLVSQRDADGDGHENGLDPCPLTANSGWDPRALNTQSFVAGWDGDGDGIPNASQVLPPDNWTIDACDGVDNDLLPVDATCNATPTTTGCGDPEFSSCGGVANDEDCDGWKNRLDNCPRIFNPGASTDAANTNQYDQDILFPAAVPESNIGPRGDAIGVSCESIDQVDIIDGSVDVNESGGVTAADDLANVLLSLSLTTNDQVDIIDGLVDVDESGAVTAADDLANVILQGPDGLDTVDIIDGAIDVNESATITTADDLTNALLILFSADITTPNGHAHRVMVVGRICMTNDRADIIDGNVDVNESGVADAADDFANSLLPLLAGGTDQVDIIDGLVDVDESGVIDTADDLADVVLTLATGGTDQVDIIDGQVDVNESGTITIADDLANANQAPGPNADDLDGDSVCNVADPDDTTDDSDGDGDFDRQDNCIATANATQDDTLMIRPDSVGDATPDNSGADGVGDACDGVGEATNAENDGDGFSNKAEVYIGTNHLIPCSMTATADDEPQDPWPPDTNDNGTVGIDDVFFGASRFGAGLGSATYTSRAEIASQNGIIDIGDVFAFASRFGSTCTVLI